MLGWAGWPINRLSFLTDVLGMGQFISDQDARRPEEFPRLSERYRASAEVVIHVPSRRKVMKGSPKAIEADVLDLSVAGALLVLPEGSTPDVGVRMKFELNGCAGVAELRNSRPASADSVYFGVSFFSMSDELRDEIFRLVGNVRSGVDTAQWERSE